MAETTLIQSRIENMLFLVIKNKRIDLLQQFATSYEDKGIQKPHQYGENVHSGLKSVYEDVNVILNIAKGHLTITGNS